MNDLEKQMWDMIHESESKRDSEPTKHMRVISSLRAQELRNLLGAVMAYKELGDHLSKTIEDIRSTVQKMSEDPMECGSHTKHYDTCAKYMKDDEIEIDIDAEDGGLNKYYKK
jgi:argonaute-like protein implicated in RNA metabolism and viral defense